MCCAGGKCEDGECLPLRDCPTGFDDACTPCLNDGYCNTVGDSFNCDCPEGFLPPLCQPTCGGVVCNDCELCVNSTCVVNEEATTCDAGPWCIDPTCNNGVCEGTCFCENGSADCPPCDSVAYPPQCHSCVNEYYLPDPTMVGTSCNDYNDTT
eukprot:UN27881